ncbi:MAG: D-aminoacyl-tRNA deacylase [Desulfurococcaceae archaeon]
MPVIGLVYSTRDPAGRGIANYIASALRASPSALCTNAETCSTGENFILAGFSEDVLYFDFLDERLPSTVEFYVVLSRHSSEAGIKSYTVHSTGNFSEEALYGGRPRELGIAHPVVAFRLLRALKAVSTRFNREDYEVSYEATHHGPTSLEKPLVFIEIGSSHSEWIDPVNHVVVGESVVALLSEYPNLPTCAISLGIGGGHYSRKFTEMSLSESVCFGHIMPKYALTHLDFEILDKMLYRTVAKPEQVVVEKKSTRREHRELIEKYAEMRGVAVKYV